MFSGIIVGGWLACMYAYMVLASLGRTLTLLAIQRRSSVPLVLASFRANYSSTHMSRLNCLKRVCDFPRRERIGI